MPRAPPATTRTTVPARRALPARQCRTLPKTRGTPARLLATVVSTSVLLDTLSQQPQPRTLLIGASCAATCGIVCRSTAVVAAVTTPLSRAVWLCVLRATIATIALSRCAFHALKYGMPPRNRDTLVPRQATVGSAIAGRDSLWKLPFGLVVQTGASRAMTCAVVAL